MRCLFFLGHSTPAGKTNCIATAVGARTQCHHLPDRVGTKPAGLRVRQSLPWRACRLDPWELIRDVAEALVAGMGRAAAQEARGP